MAVLDALNTKSRLSVSLIDTGVPMVRPRLLPSKASFVVLEARQTCTTVDVSPCVALWMTVRKDIASAGASELDCCRSDSEPIMEEFMENCSSSWASRLPVETPVTRLQTVTRESGQLAPVVVAIGVRPSWSVKVHWPAPVPAPPPPTE